MMLSRKQESGSELINIARFESKLFIRVTIQRRNKDQMPHPTKFAPATVRALLHATEAWHTLVHLSHATVILVHGIELKTQVNSCYTNHISVTAADSLFSYILQNDNRMREVH